MLLGYNEKWPGIDTPANFLYSNNSSQHLVSLILRVTALCSVRLGLRYWSMDMMSFNIRRSRQGATDVCLSVIERYQLNKFTSSC